MTEVSRYATRAITALEMPRILAEKMKRPVIVLRARRGGRRRFEQALAPMGERAIQILDADGYLMVVVENAQEQRRIIRDLKDGPHDLDITAWDKKGETVALTKGDE